MSSGQFNTTGSLAPFLRVEEKRRKIKMENKNGIGRIGLIALIVSSCIGTGIFGITNAVAAAAAGASPGAAGSATHCARVLLWPLGPLYSLGSSSFLAFLCSFLRLTTYRKNGRTWKRVSSHMPAPALGRWGNLFPVGPTGCQLGWVTLPLPPC